VFKTGKSSSSYRKNPAAQPASGSGRHKEPGKRRADLAQHKQERDDLRAPFELCLKKTHAKGRKLVGDGTKGLGGKDG